MSSKNLNIQQWEDDLNEREKALEEEMKRFAEDEQLEDLDGEWEAMMETKTLLKKQELKYMEKLEEQNERDKSLRSWSDALEKRKKDLYGRRVKVSEKARDDSNIEVEYQLFDKTKVFKAKLLDKVHASCQKQRDLEVSKLSVLSKLQDKLDVSDAFWRQQGLSQLSLDDNYSRECELSRPLSSSTQKKTEEKTKQMQHGNGSGDGIGKNEPIPPFPTHHNLSKRKETIPLNQSNDLSSACLNLVDESDPKWSETLQKGFQVVRLRNMLNQKTTTLTYKSKFVANITAKSDVEGSGNSESYQLSSAMENTASDAFKSAIDNVHEKLQSMSRSRSRASSVCGSTTSSRR